MKKFTIFLFSILITGSIFSQENIFPLSKYEIPTNSSSGIYYKDSIHSKTLRTEVYSPVVVNFEQMTLATGMQIDVIIDTIEYDEETLNPTVYGKDTAQLFIGQLNTTLPFNSYYEFASGATPLAIGDTIHDINNFSNNFFVSNMPVKTVFHVIVHGTPTLVDEVYDCSLSELFTVGGEPTYNLGRSEIVQPANEIIEVCRVDLVSGLRKTNNINFSISPNPSSGLVIIHSEEEIKLVEILTLEGIVKHQETETNNINLSHLASGVYIIKIQTNKGISSKKIVIE